MKKHDDAVARSNAAAKVAKAKGDASVKAAAKLAGDVKKAIAKVKDKKVKTITGKTVVGGADDFDEIVGELGYGSSVVGADDLGGFSAEDLAALGLSPADVNDVGPSAPITIDRTKSWSGPVPEDAVVYDGSKGYPDNCFGSYNVFYASHRNQHGWGKGMIFASGHWKFLDTKDRDRTWVFNDVPAIYKNDAKLIQENSIARGWGPLIGSPGAEVLPAGSVAAQTAVDWTKGLLYCAAENKWFWLRTDAPKWATQEMDLAAAKLAEDAAAADAAAQAAAQAAADKDAADLAEAQAKQEAQNALAQAQAEAEQQTAQTQQATTDIATQAKIDASDIALRQAQQAQEMKLEAMRAQQEMAAQQAAAQQAAAQQAADLSQQQAQQQADLAAQQANLAAAAAQAALDVKRQQAALDFAAANPEAPLPPAFGQPQYEEPQYEEPQGGGGDAAAEGFEESELRENEATVEEAAAWNE